MKNITEYNFTGKCIMDLGKFGVEKGTTITYPTDYLENFLRWNQDKQIIVSMKLEVKP